MSMTVGEYILSRNIPLLDKRISNVIIIRTNENFFPQIWYNPFDYLATIETWPDGFDSKLVYEHILTKYATTDDITNPEKNKILPLRATKTLTYAREDNGLDLYIIIPKEDE